MQDLRTQQLNRPMPRRLGTAVSLLWLFHLSKSSSQTRAVVDPSLLRSGDQGYPLEITLDEAVEADPRLDGELRPNKALDLSPCLKWENVFWK